MADKHADTRTALLPARDWPIGCRRQNTPLCADSSASGRRPITAPNGLARGAAGGAAALLLPPARCCRTWAFVRGLQGYSRP
jgi:hypothetical protein